MAQCTSTLFSQFLTLKAVPRPRDCFQSFRLDVVAAFSALAKYSSGKPLESLSEIPKGLSGERSFVRQCLPFVLGGCLVGSIGLPRRICSYFLL